MTTTSFIFPNAGVFGLYFEAVSELQDIKNTNPAINPKYLNIITYFLCIRCKSTPFGCKQVNRLVIQSCFVLFHPAGRQFFRF